jgi:hypothetical protein
MENDIDTNEYYASYHVKGWFDCCWVIPKIRLPKHISSVDIDDIEILNVYKRKI